MAAFNGANTIERALQSVAEQDTKIDEIICIDDGSTDGTFTILESWKQRLPLKLLRNPVNQGLSRSLITGVNAASCKWILRLDADDMWLPSHVATLVALMGRSNVVLVAAPANVKNADGQTTGRSRAISDDSIRRDLMWDNPICHSASGFLREAYHAVGGYSATEAFEDYGLWIRLLALGALNAATHPTINYFVYPHSLSRQSRARSICKRWRHQQTAINKFYARHPVAALNYQVICSLRGAVAYSTLAIESRQPFWRPYNNESGS
jgi:glycosyltransferase involved in cell wall biosynthesis